jgi:DNA-binding response OmpR family regulator
MSPSLNSQVVSLAEVPLKDAILSMEERRRVILIVDDERVIADTLSIILSRSGFATFTAYDGISALELADIVRPELLISDVVMPGMTGVELAISLGHLVPDCKILLFSGQAATADLLSKARELGHDFTTLTKPVHPTDMLRRISECFNSAASGQALLRA